MGARGGGGRRALRELEFGKIQGSLLRCVSGERTPALPGLPGGALEGDPAGSLLVTEGLGGATLRSHPWVAGLQAGFLKANGWRYFILCLLFS